MLGMCKSKRNERCERRVLDYCEEFASTNTPLKRARNGMRLVMIRNTAVCTDASVVEYFGVFVDTCVGTNSKQRM